MAGGAVWRVSAETGGTFAETCFFKHFFRQVAGAVPVARAPSAPAEPDRAVSAAICAGAPVPCAIRRPARGRRVATDAPITRRLNLDALVTPGAVGDVFAMGDATTWDLQDADRDVTPPRVGRRDRFGVVLSQRSCRGSIP